ncbi:hypothetical protein [Cupriavidus sp. CuC1]|uniref:hypothetical protein n=1 Tax=Cupriavidus sp. CuC1 TaxID=3373131 RepID=UPI0037CF510F
MLRNIWRRKLSQAPTAVQAGPKIWAKYRFGAPAKPFAHNHHHHHQLTVVVHLETGRKLLCVNQVFTTHAPALSAKESDAMLDKLYRRIKNPRPARCA